MTIIPNAIYVTPLGRLARALAMLRPANGERTSTERIAA